LIAAGGTLNFPQRVGRSPAGRRILDPPLNLSESDSDVHQKKLETCWFLQGSTWHVGVLSRNATLVQRAVSIETVASTLSWFTSSPSGTFCKISWPGRRDFRLKDQRKDDFI